VYDTDETQYGCEPSLCVECVCMLHMEWNHLDREEIVRGLFLSDCIEFVI